MAQSNFTYISTASSVGVENSNDGVMAKVNFKQGKVSPSAQAATSGTTDHVAAVGDSFVKIEVKSGKESAEVYNQNWAIKQVISSPISGFNANGAANFGDGAISKASTWPADTEKTAPVATYLVAGKPHDKTFAFQGTQP